jgi:hypothetical protein
MTAKAEMQLLRVLLFCCFAVCCLQDAQPGQPMEVRDMVRDMNCATSQRVFIGERARDAAA